MANQTITTAVNYDAASISGLLNGETITCNAGSLLTINADVRWNQQAAVMGTLSMQSSGSFLIDGTQVWEVPFSASTGNVPTQAALGSNGVTGGTSGATGELTRVWATGSLTPAAAGGAMPATGFVKLRSRTGNFQNGETITLPGGATVTASGAGQRSWIHVVGAETTSISGSTLTGTYDLTGDWYELGTTNGADDQTFQFPVADTCPAIWVETAASSGVYEVWLCAGDRWGTATQFIPTTGERGKWFGIDRTTGVITIARRATNSCGTKPASGCKVRIGNIICSSSTSANWDANTLNSNTESRYRINTTYPYAASKITSNLYHSVQRATLTDSGVSHALNAGTIMTRVGIGICLNFAAQNNVTSIFTSGLIRGCSWTDVRVGSFGRSGQAIINFTNTNNITWTRVRIDVFGDTAAATRGGIMRWVAFTGCNDVSIDDYTVIGAETTFSACNRVTVNNQKYADLMLGTTVATGAQYALSTFTNCQNFNISEFSTFDGLANVHPYSGLYLFDTYNNFTVTNIGSSASPYNLGTANAGRVIAAFGAGETLLMRRVYTVNPATGNVQITSGTSRSFQLINVWGNGTINTNWNQSDGAVVKGCRFGVFQTPVGQAGGWFFNDVVSSDTAGAIDAIFAPASTSALTSALMTQSGLYLKNVGDSMTVEMDYFSLGHTGFTSIVSSLTNQTVEFQYDIGSGWNGTWLAATTANVTAIGAIDPATGVKLRVRTTATAANAVVGSIRFVTSTTSSAAQTQYPLPVPIYDIAITNIVSGSRMQIYNETTATELFNAVVTGTEYTATYENGVGYSNGDIVRVRLTYQSGTTAKVDYEARAEVDNGWSLFAQQENDTVYNTIGLNGSTITEFSADYPNVQIDLNDPDYETTVHRLYAWWMYNLTTANGIRNWVGGLIAEDMANFKILPSLINIKLDNVASTTVNFVGGIRLYRSDGTSPVVNSTTGGGSIVLYADKVYVDIGNTVPTAAQVAEAVWNKVLP